MQLHKYAIERMRRSARRHPKLPTHLMQENIFAGQVEGLICGAEPGSSFSGSPSKAAIGGCLVIDGWLRKALLTNCNFQVRLQPGLFDGYKIIVRLKPCLVHGCGGKATMRTGSRLEPGAYDTNRKPCHTR